MWKTQSPGKMWENDLWTIRFPHLCCRRVSEGEGKCSHCHAAVGLFDSWGFYFYFDLRDRSDIECFSLIRGVHHLGLTGILMHIMHHLSVPVRWHLVNMVMVNICEHGKVSVHHLLWFHVFPFFVTKFTNFLSLNSLNFMASCSFFLSLNSLNDVHTLQSWFSQSCQSLDQFPTLLPKLSESWPISYTSRKKRSHGYHLPNF